MLGPFLMSELILYYGKEVSLWRISVHDSRPAIREADIMTVSRANQKLDLYYLEYLLKKPSPPITPQIVKPIPVLT